jgi:hypothetical protein
MKLFIKTTLLTLLAALLLGIGNPGYGSKWPVKYAIEVKLEPVPPMLKGAPISLSLSYSLIDSISTCQAAESGSYSLIFINPRNYGDTLSRVDFKVRHNESYSHSTTIQVDLPDADTCWLHVDVRIGTCDRRPDYYFIATGDVIEFRPNFTLPPPIEYQPKKPDSQYHVIEVDRDTLSQEQLRTPYDMIIDLRNKEHFRIVKEILGSIPDTCSVLGLPGHYIINMTLEQGYELYDMGLRIEEARGKRYKRIGQDQPEEIKKEYYIDEQGARDIAPDGISLDSVVPSIAL